MAICKGALSAAGHADDASERWWKGVVTHLRAKVQLWRREQRRSFQKWLVVSLPPAMLICKAQAPQISRLQDLSLDGASSSSLKASEGFGIMDPQPSHFISNVLIPAQAIGPLRPS